MKAGTGRSRTDRHRIPYIPIIYRISGKKRKQEKVTGKRTGAGSNLGEALSLTDSTDPVLIREIPVKNPVYVFFSDPTSKAPKYFSPAHQLRSVEHIRCLSPAFRSHFIAHQQTHFYVSFARWY